MQHLWHLASSRPGLHDQKLADEEPVGAQIRKIIAKRLLESKQTVPHLYLRADADLDPVSSMRNSMKQQGTKVRKS